jgi:hypothetical protein
MELWFDLEKPESISKDEEERLLKEIKERMAWVNLEGLTAKAMRQIAGRRSLGKRKSHNTKRRCHKK